MKDAPFLSSMDVFDEARHWTYRVILASFPTTCGAIVRAVLCKNPRNGWAYGIACEIDKDGMVRTAVRDPAGTVTSAVPIGSVVAVRDALRRLADHCKLNDTDREALFEELRKWIRRDHRAKSEA